MMAEHQRGAASKEIARQLDLPERRIMDVLDAPVERNDENVTAPLQIGDLLENGMAIYPIDQGCILRVASTVLVVGKEPDLEPLALDDFISPLRCRPAGADEANPLFPQDREGLIETEHPMPVEADGEMLGTTPLRFEILPGILRLRT